MKYSFFIIGLFAFISLFTSCSEDNFDTTTTETEEIDVKESTSQNNIMTRASSSQDQSTELLFDCLSLKYPFELVDVNGSIITVDNNDAYASVVFDSIVVDFNYPLIIIDGSDEEVEVNDATEFAELFASCIPNDIWNDIRFPAYLIDEANECYALVFPLSVYNEAEENLELDTREEFLEAITKEELYFNLPFNIVSTDGEEFSVNNLDDFYNAIFACNGFESDSLGLDWEDGFEYIGCYKLEFPLPIVDVDGSIITVENHEALCDLMIEGRVKDFAYPIELIGEDGELVVANSNEEFNDLIYSCYDDPYYADGSISLLLQGAALRLEQPCYTISYPLTVSQIDTIGNTMTYEVSSDDELAQYEFDGFTLEYPIDITYEDGSVSTVNQFEDLFEISQICFEINFFNGLDIVAFSDGFDTCFDFSYPINVAVFDTSNFETDGFERTEIYNSKEEFLENIENVIYVEFPFTVILKSDGKEEEITDLEKFVEFLDSCD